MMQEFQPYSERSAQIALESDIAVHVLLNDNGSDIQFWPLQPRQAVLTGPEEFVRRRLRSVGVVGLAGAKPLCAFCEPLEPHVTDAVAQAFLEYVRVLLADGFAAHLERGDSLQWLENLYALEDKRPEV